MNYKFWLIGLSFVLIVLIFTLPIFIKAFQKADLYMKEELAVYVPLDVALNELGRIKSSIEKYKTDQGVYPFPEIGFGKTTDLYQLTTPTAYIKTIPVDPFGNPYYYIYYDNPSDKFKELYFGNYVLFSKYRDGTRDTFEDSYKEYSIADGLEGKGDVITFKKPWEKYPSSKVHP